MKNNKKNTQTIVEEEGVITNDSLIKNNHIRETQIAEKKKQRKEISVIEEKAEKRVKEELRTQRKNTLEI